MTTTDKPASALPVAVRIAARRLRAGGVIAYPTEGVWGLGCDPDNAAAVARLLRLKHRDPDKGLILVAADIDQFSAYLRGLDETQRQRLGAGWPGPLTWLVPDCGAAPAWIRGRHRQVALRVSAHPLIAALCRAFGGPIVSTSANPAGRPAAVSALRARRYFAGRLDYVLSGALGGRSGPTPIRDLLTDKILREG
jgi:L-threonylcarbamoyladenylate synthase